MPIGLTLMGRIIASKCEERVGGIGPHVCIDDAVAEVVNAANDGAN
jgi:hypothetical protein